MFLFPIQIDKRKKYRNIEKWELKQVFNKDINILICQKLLNNLTNYMN